MKTAAKKAPAKTPSKSTALAKTNSNTAVVLKSAAMFEEDHGAASDFDRNDLAIPRISIIQSNSPQVKKAEGKYIKGAEEGDFLDSVTNEVFAKGEEGFKLVIVSYRRTDIEWIPRTKGGGFVADHGSSSNILSQCTKDEDTGAMLLKNGHEIVTTAEYLAFAIKPDGEARQVCISLAKTQLKKARRLNTLLSQLRIKKASGAGTFNPANFYSYFNVTALPEQSKKGESFMGWGFERGGNTVDLDGGEELYMFARAFRESINEGKVKVAQPNEGTAEPEDDDSSL